MIGKIYNIRKIHLRDNTWSFAGSDGVVTPQKLLEYINKKTERNVFIQYLRFNFKNQS